MSVKTIRGEEVDMSAGAQEGAEPCVCEGIEN
jgi:hypothetical protein